VIPFTCRRLYGAVAVLVFAAACSKGDKSPPPDSVRPETLITPVKAMPGALTKPIDQYTGDELYTFVKGLSYAGKHDKQRNCKGAPGCGGTKKVKVTVDAVATQDSVAASNAPQYGVVYIRAINDGDATEARYNLEAGKKFEYYMIVSRTASDSMQWRLEQLDTTPNARTHKQIGTGVFEGCAHPWKAGAQANFKTCADTSTASIRGKTVRLGLKLQGDDDPMWAACAGGCCVAK
jgi:hypothetical protein